MWHGFVACGEPLKGLGKDLRQQHIILVVGGLWEMQEMQGCELN